MPELKPHNFVNKKLKFIMPLVKAQVEEDGYYYLKFGLSTETTDLEKEQVSPEAIDDMINQAKAINSFACHQYGLDDVLGPIVDSWKDKTEKGIDVMMIKVRVVPSLKAKIKELVDAGVRLGGSFGGMCLEDEMVDGIRLLKKILLLEGSLTPLPVNWDTLGTAEETTKGCKNGLCTQIVKSIRDKYDLPEQNLEVKNVTRTEDESYEAIRVAVEAAMEEAYPGEGYSPTWIRLTFPDSVIYENWEEGKTYELPYSIDEEGNVTLGEPVEVQEQYVEKKLEVFKTKSMEHEPPADYKEKTIGDENMDETKVQKMIDDSNAKLLGEIKGLLKPEKEVEETPAIDAAEMTKSITEDVTKNLLKSFGIEEEEEAPEDGKIVIMDQKALEDLQADAIQKTILEIAKQREGTRKSKSLGSSKFEIPGESEEEAPEKTKSGKVSTRKAAEMVAERKGLA